MRGVCVLLVVVTALAVGSVWAVEERQEGNVHTVPSGAVVVELPPPPPVANDAATAASEAQAAKRKQEEDYARGFTQAEKCERACQEYKLGCEEERDRLCDEEEAEKEAHLKKELTRCEGEDNKLVASTACEQACADHDCAQKLREETADLDNQVDEIRDGEIACRCHELKCAKEKELATAEMKAKEVEMNNLVTSAQAQAIAQTKLDALRDEVGPLPPTEENKDDAAAEGDSRDALAALARMKAMEGDLKTSSGPLMEPEAVACAAEPPAMPCASSPGAAESIAEDTLDLDVPEAANVDLPVV